MRSPWKLMKRRQLLVCAALLGAASISGAAVYMAMQPSVEAAEPLSAYAPQGSLMAVESPDFAGLLAAWTNSDEEKAWVKSDNYAEFSHSRLFSRLGEAQSEFAASAGLAPDAKFLSQVAGGESLFAWYDIGKLEFLYVTRMKPGEAANSPLMKLKDKFQMRRAGADSFYIQAEAAQDGSTNQGGAGDQDAQGSVTASVRTVAFAVHGDLLLMATREDLIANALLLAQHQGDATLKNEPWYTAAVSAVEAGKNGARPDMRMTLNLAKIVPSPYFRSYWMQQNVTEMKQYSAAVSDLYRGTEAFREERVLIPKADSTRGDAVLGTGDLRPILKYLPANFGVYRAAVRPETAEVIEEFDRRLISRSAASYRDLRIAPVADLSSASAGSAGDLDTRIDEQPVPEVSAEKTLNGLKGMIDAARPDAMLVYSSGSGGAANAVFQPVHSAVVLTAGTPWDTDVVQSALVAALRERLTVGGVGLSWRARQEGGESWMELSSLQPLAISVRGGALVVASDSETLLRLLQSSKSGGQVPDQSENLKVVAGFNHTAERERYLRLAALLDRNHAVTGGGDSSTVTDSPDYFSKDLGSLSETFKALDSETFVEGPETNGVVRQTVIYRWRR